MFGKDSDEWRTPRYFFDLLDQSFDFTLDGAANTENHLCERWTGPGGNYYDALHQGTWANDVVFCNPPYSKISDFMAHAQRESRIFNARVAMLVANRSSEKWYDWVWHADEVWILRGRIPFEHPGKEKASAPFPSLVVIFNGSRPVNLIGNPRFCSWNWRKDLK
jgi:site-specific DNA-methyltransferase (adenine-specific)